VSATTRGQAAVNLFIAWALEYGDDICIPIHDNRPWDVLLRIRGDEPQVSQRVQVKRIYTKDGNPTVNLVRRNGVKYQPEDADYLAAVDMRKRLVYLVPWHLVCGYTRKSMKDYLEYCYEL
jgi:hypothetical protein